MVMAYKASKVRKRNEYNYVNPAKALDPKITKKLGELENKFLG